MCYTTYKNLLQIKKLFVHCLKIKTNIMIQFKLLKTKLEYEIEDHFENGDVDQYLDDNTLTYDLYFEIKENGLTYIIQGKYHFDKIPYKKEEIQCFKYINNNCIPVDFKIVAVNNNPNKRSLHDILEAIADKEKEKRIKRQKDN